MGRFASWLAIGLQMGGIAAAQDLTLPLPPVKTSISIGDQPIAITATGVITGHPNSLQDTFRLLLTADLADLQEHMTGILKAQLDSEDRCGERLSITSATLLPPKTTVPPKSAVPAHPAAALTVNVHYERWLCVKALGREVNRKLLGGDGVIPVDLTPSIEGSEVKLLAEVGTIEATGTLGEVLRAPPIRDRLRDKIGSSIQSALQGGANLKTVVPPNIERVATLVSARFADAGSGRLSFELVAEIRLSAAEILEIIGK
jgi:hypothetical protein